MDTAHKTVLLEETLEQLELRKGLAVFEGTAGGGGLSAEIAKRISGGTFVVGDLDAKALERVEARVGNFKGKIHFVRDNFRNIKSILTKLSIREVDRIVLDLGLSSDELENSGRGFSFLQDEPLLMTFDSEAGGILARDVVNDWSEQSLASVIWGFGGERHSRKIAAAIVVARSRKAINTSKELADIISSVLPRSGALHPATKTFQAIRMAVNDELGALEQVLTDGWEMLSIEGRYAVISFHEAEDRIVKHFFLMKARVGEAELLTKKPLTPSRSEVLGNPRSRSAKLRVVKKISK